MGHKRTSSVKFTVKGIFPRPFTLAQIKQPILAPSIIFWVSPDRSQNLGLTVVSHELSNSVTIIIMGSTVQFDLGLELY